MSQSILDDYMMLTLFYFLLIGKTMQWLQNEPSGSITSWNTLFEKFNNRFLSSKKIKYLRDMISRFVQKYAESRPKAWKRYEGYLRDLPYYHQPNKIIRHKFIKGLRPESKSF